MTASEEGHLMELGLSGTWHFTEQSKDDVDDATVAARNFARESRKLSGIFVREFFQNVLDARITGPDDRPITPVVRISLLKVGTGLEPKVLSSVLSEAHDHLIAAGHDPARWREDNANALVLEEYHTSGLTGETENSRANGENERWANFWFGEGKRSKGGRSLGRAGQGKITYHEMSGTHSVFALTKQNGSGKEFLFGKCIVQRTHELDDMHYKRHGYWPKTREDKQPLPATSPVEISSFKKAFKLERNGEPGTSWVIPYVDPDAFSREHLIREILRDFYFSILRGDLVVEVMGIAINDSNLMNLIKEFKVEGLSAHYIEFLTEAITLPEDAPSVIHAGANWYGSGAGTPMAEDALSDENLEKAQAALERQELIAVRLPVKVTTAESEERSTSILVFLQKPEQLAKTEEIYVRSGLVIGEERHLRDAPGRYFGVMLADDDTVSEFLGDAEEASHMKWNNAEQEVNERYKNVKHTIAQIRHSLPKLARLLTGHTSERQNDALVDFLSIPSQGNAGHSVSGKKKKKKKKPEEPKIPEPQRPAIFRIGQAGSKWKLEPGPGAAELQYPVKVALKLAYETMPGEGNPFKLYHPFEFDLADETSFPVSTQNVAIHSRDLNELEIELTSADFALAIDGFAEHALKSRISGGTE